MTCLSKMDCFVAMLLAMTGIALTALPAHAEFEWELEGNIEAELRLFPNDVEGGMRKDANVSLSIDPIAELFFGRDHSITINPYFRIDQNDGRRTHFDVRQLKWIGVFDNLEVRVGFDKVFWGVTESVHLVDIVNQDDGVEDVDGEDKLGQPLVSLSYVTDFGTFTGIIMPYFRERTFPGRDGRPRAPLFVDTKQDFNATGSNNWHPDFALRYAHTFSVIDLGVSYFDGISRDPMLLPGVGETGDPVLIPFYDKINQIGVDLQATVDAWLLKFEGITVNGRNQDRSWSFGAGFEYTFYQVFESDADIGILVEYLWDSRGSAAPTPFESDLFFGLRWEGNDEQTTRVLGGVIFDLDTGTKNVFIEASRRLGDRWRITVDARFSIDVSPTDPTFPFREDDFVQVRLARFF
ncbi:MAG: hypothetical protein ACE363_01270 [Alphaproteobacteria bacterium]